MFGSPPSMSSAGSGQYCTRNLDSSARLAAMIVLCIMPATPPHGQNMRSRLLAPRANAAQCVHQVPAVTVTLSL